jgi:hypothetical protein
LHKRRNNACGIQAKKKLILETCMPASLRQRTASSGQTSLVTAALVLGMIYAGSPLLAPPYPLYQRTFGISEPVVTLIHATYVVGNLGALFLFESGVRPGRAPARESDRAGSGDCEHAAFSLCHVSGMVSLCIRAASGMCGRMSRSRWYRQRSR